ncbi:PREDICTED: U-box domain-containing protein 21-like [Populus euphratica]|uniref:U-box domain-containing protein n=1 Tax=Populus euphratica TaxID=75702 RepID=A0AAJ6U1V3_POPEU|nr:PREDICTED: U-box domain-containing protein 21-like [Populus euphratica]
MMISTWRKRRAARLAGKRRLGSEMGDIEVTIPNHFRCPISLELMKDPVTMSSGITYDRESIEKWIEAGNVTCPVTNRVLRSLDPIPNHTIRKMIQDWCVANSSYGIERIPTPRIPVSSEEALEIHFKIKTACKNGDQIGCQNLAAKIKALAKESERDKSCLVATGTAGVLSYAFEEFSKASFEENVAVLDEILSSLAVLLHHDKATNCPGSDASIDRIVLFLKSEDLSARRNAVLVLKELVPVLDYRKVDMFLEIEGAMEALFKLIKAPICHAATKASLMVIYHMVTSPSPSSAKIIAKFVDLGLVSLLLEMLVDAERSLCEEALGVLDGICGSDQGREEAYNHALTIPVLVRKIHRVSDLAMKFSVSILFKLCMNEKRENGGVLVEAIQRNAFEKLLVLLQVGCDERTKEKATQLLRVLNAHRSSVDCIDSVDFKNVKRPF